MGAALELDLSPTGGRKRKADDAISVLDQPRRTQVSFEMTLNPEKS